MDILSVLKKEKELNDLLNDENCPEDINEQFDVLFSNDCYVKTNEWFSKNNIFTLHDSFILNFSQKKQINEYQISFNIDSMPIYKDSENIGYTSNSKFKITSKDSLRELNNKCILSFLIDEEKKEIAFSILNNWKRHVVLFSFSEIAFEKGKDVFYSNEKKNKFSI